MVGTPHAWESRPPIFCPTGHSGATVSGQVTAVSPLLLEGPDLLFYGSVCMSGGSVPPPSLFDDTLLIADPLSHLTLLSHFVPDGWILPREFPGDTPKIGGLLASPPDGDRDKTFAMRRKATYVLHVLSPAEPPRLPVSPERPPVSDDRPAIPRRAEHSPLALGRCQPW